MAWLYSLSALIVVIAILYNEVDIDAFRLPVHDLVEAHVRKPKPEPACTRLRGPIGAEDAVVLGGSPPVLILSELDAGVHEFTNLEEHGTSASTSPRGTLWAIDHFDRK